MKKINFNTDWMFWKDETPTAKRLVHLPHDAMLEEKRIPGLINGAATGYFPGGKYFYTKQIASADIKAGETVILEFEGIYQKSEVYLNNKKVGGRIYGYSNFFVDLTGKFIEGKENEIKVIADNTQVPNSRWYTGSGIYRDVNLFVGGKNYIKPEGVKIQTVSIHPAVIRIDIDYVAVGEMKVKTEIYRGGRLITAENGNHREISIWNADLWDAEHPNLYQARVLLESDQGIEDEEVVTFGIHILQWNSAEGLLENGVSIKLKGACVHHDYGFLGACEFQAAAYRRVRTLKEVGYNAIRSSHNPLSKAMLRACDELGMYVLDETFDMWCLAKNEYDYSLYFDQEWQKDTKAMIEKDFNHPSVIMYSIGNEITDIAACYGVEINKEMVRYCHELDPTRPVTNAANAMTCNSRPKNKKKPVPKVSADDVVNPKRESNMGQLAGSLFINKMVTLMPWLLSNIKAEKVKDNIKDLMESLDIVGFNYGSGFMEAFKEADSKRILLSTETFPKDIGINWPIVVRNPHIIGDFMWTGCDYLGEAGIGVVLYGKQPRKFNKPYPCISANIGSVDLTGQIEAQGYYTAIVYGNYRKPYIGVHPLDHAGERVHMGTWRGTDVLSSWSWVGYEGKKAGVSVFSIGKEVELWQDGKCIRRTELINCQADFELEYQPGELRAVSFDQKGNTIAETALKTAGMDTILKISADKKVMCADGMDLAFIDISLTDKEGIIKVLEERKVKIEVEGAAVLAAVGSCNPWTTESYLADTFTTYHGKMQAVIRSTKMPGEIKITARADGMKGMLIFSSKASYNSLKAQNHHF